MICCPHGYPGGYVCKVCATIDVGWLNSLGGSYCEDSGCWTFATPSGLEIIVTPLSDAEKQWHVSFMYNSDFLSPPNMFEYQRQLLIVFEVFGYQQRIAN